MNRLAAFLGGVGLLLAPQGAAAKLACYPLDRIEAALGAEYGERRQFAGRESEGVEYRLYVNGETGSWSWIGIPAGTQIGCLLFAGNVKRDRSEREPSDTPPPPAAHF
jgi:hypothetical protein